MAPPLVGLGVTPIPQVDVLGNMSRLSALRGAQQAQQIQAQQAPLVTQQLQQQLKSGQLDLEQRMYVARALGIDPDSVVQPGEAAQQASQPTQPGQPAPAAPSAIQQQQPASADDWITRLGSNPLTAPYAEAMQKIQQGQDIHEKASQEIDQTRNENLGLAAYSIKGLVDNGVPMPQAIGAIQKTLEGYNDPWYRQKMQTDLQSIRGDKQAGFQQLLQQYMGNSKAAQTLINSKTEAGAKALEAKYKVVNGQLVDVSGAQPKPVDYSGLKPSDWDSVVDSAVPPKENPSLNASTKAQVNFYVGKGNIEQAQKVLSDATGKVSQIDVETDPRVLMARAQETATAQTMVERARQAMYPSALAGVAPQLVTAATTAMDKSGQDYAKAVQTSNDLNDLITEAKSGNKAAVRIVPLQGALEITTAQGVHRINRTEVDQYGSAGSLLDKISGEAGGVLTGKNIPDNVLGDMQTMQNMISQNAKKLHENSVKTINSTYGSKFQPMQFGQQGTQGPASGMTRIKASDGNLHDIPSTNIGRARKIDPNLIVVTQ